MSTSTRIGYAPVSRARMSLLFTAAIAGVVAVGGRHTLAAGLGDVFVIDMENQNWTQPDGNVASVSGTTYNGGTVGGGIQQIKNNPAAPYINSLVTAGNPNAAQVSFTNSYYNVLATAGGNNPSIHPSEPNYLWQESGSNFSIANDNDPYQSGNNVSVIQNYLAANPSVSGQNLSGLLQNAGIPWKSYQEDTDLATVSGSSFANGNQAAYNGQLGGANATTLTNTPVSQVNYTVPLSSFSGTSNSYTNAYNGSHQYNFAAKHDGTLFFAGTNGGNDATTANTEASHYAPLQQLTSELSSGNVGKYNLITPDQYNDMHTSLTGGFKYNGIQYTGDAAQIAQGDNFLSIIVPQIMASSAYQNNGAIVIWTDETEPDSTGGSQNDLTHTLMEIVISPLAKGNAYVSTQYYTHSSDVKTLQELFNVGDGTGNGFLNDAATAGTNDLSDMFTPGTIHTVSAVPEPASLAALGLGALALVGRRRRRSA